MDLIKKTIINFEDFNRLVSKLVRDINIDDDWKPDSIVGITRGGLLPAVMISHYFNIPMISINLSFRDNKDNNEETLDPMIEFMSRYKSTLIIDDINDTGETLKHIENVLMGKDKSNVADVGPLGWDLFLNGYRFAVIVNNLASKSTVDYSALEINKDEDDSWIVFPYENWFS